MRDEVRRITEQMQAQRYITDAAVATSVYLALELRKPLLVEGHAGVGKTEIAKVLAAALDTRLIRLQCYEGLDATHALYEWNYPKQLLRIKLDEGSERAVEEREQDIFSEPFLLRRPLLDAIAHHGKPPVLLVDEVDRADEEFEAFLLEVLSDYQVSIPEIGTLKSTDPPYVVLTSNRTRDLSDALRRRCLYLWIDYPTFEKELAIVEAKVPGCDGRLAAEISAFVQSLRGMDLEKVPGVAESLDWARALVALHADHLEEAVVVETLGAIVKDRRDADRVRVALEEGRLDAMTRAPA